MFAVVIYYTVIHLQFGMKALFHRVFIGGIGTLQTVSAVQFHSSFRDQSGRCNRSQAENILFCLVPPRHTSKQTHDSTETFMYLSLFLSYR